MGEETEDFTVFTWPISDYRRQDKKVTSPEFSCAGHKWCVVGLVEDTPTPQADAFCTLARWTGIFCCSQWATRTGKQMTWCRSTSTTAIRRRPKDGMCARSSLWPSPTLQIRRFTSRAVSWRRFPVSRSWTLTGLLAPRPTEAHHRFTNEEQDWGFTRFVELRKLFSVSEGRPRAIIEGDETVITAYVRVLKDPTGVLWHNFNK